jgi:hypothetical protein
VCRYIPSESYERKSIKLDRITNYLFFTKNGKDLLVSGDPSCNIKECIHIPIVEHTTKSDKVENSKRVNSYEPPVIGVHTQEHCCGRILAITNSDDNVEQIKKEARSLIGKLQSEKEISKKSEKMLELKNSNSSKIGPIRKKTQSLICKQHCKKNIFKESEKVKVLKHSKLKLIHFKQSQMEPIKVKENERNQQNFERKRYRKSDPQINEGSENNPICCY